MEQSERMECEILLLAVDETHWRGHNTSLSPLIERLRPHIPNADSALAVEACKLAYPDYVVLLKWDASLQDFREYRGDEDDTEFFYRGDFWLKRTPRLAGAWRN